VVKIKLECSTLLCTVYVWLHAHGLKDVSSSFLVAGNCFRGMYMKNDVIVTTCKEVEVCC